MTHPTSAIALELIEKNKLSKSPYLDLGNCGLTSVPIEITEYYWLKTLILSSVWVEYDNNTNRWYRRSSENRGPANTLKTLDGIQHLIQLTALFCAGNSIDNIKPLRSLPKLEKLNCSNNRIKGITPLSICTNLRVVILSKNPISGLRSLRRCSSIMALDISSTNIADISNIQHFERLKALNISQCAIEDGGFLEWFSHLRILNCANTKLTEISAILPHIRKGIRLTLNGFASENEFDFKGCPLVRPPIEIIQKGSTAVQEYLQRLENEEKEELLEAKVLLIGEAMSGKTSLRNRLLNRPLPESPDRTKGLEVEMEPYKFLIDEGAELQLNIFDFGGQDHYKPLHQFFYSKRSLYILLTKNGDDQNDFEFWLDTVKLHGKDSPLLIVNNLFGDTSCTFNKSTWDRKYPNLQESLVVDLLLSRGVSEVEKNIKAYAQTLPHIREVVPKSWAKIRRRIQALKLKRPFITLDQYLTVCAKCGIKERESALHLSQYLNDIGLFLHFQENPALKRWIILQHEWATEAVYRILDDSKIQEQKGHFTQKDYDRIWSTKEYVDMQDALLALMTEFRLCYSKPNGKGHIAPTLLPFAPERFPWIHNTKQRSLILEYEFLPRVLFTQFLVSQHEKIADGRLCIWRSGAVFERGQTRVLAQKHGKNQIELRAEGPEIVGLLTILNDALSDLHQHTPGLAVERKIPCTCSICINSDKPYIFNKSRLDRRVLHGRYTDECQISFQDVPIPDLLGNVLLPDDRKNKISLSHKEQITQLMKKGYSQKAIDVFLSVPTLDPEKKRTLEINASQLSRLERELRQGIVTADHERTERAKIDKTILSLLGGLT